MNKNLTKATHVIKKGGIVIFPTDTAFGIGCRIDDEKAVERLFKIRKRPQDKAMLILASSYKMVSRYIKNIDINTLGLAKKYWPGGLTIVFEANEDTVPNIVRGGKKTIAIRIPAHETMLKLIRQVGVPILAPSANFSGGNTPYKLKDLDNDLVGLVDFVLVGRCKIKEQSTIIDSTGIKPKILREGSVKLKV